jgi:hypothetical protein
LTRAARAAIGSPPRTGQHLVRRAEKRARRRDHRVVADRRAPALRAQRR